MRRNMSQDAPTKICTSCGQRKPLSAFLQMNKSGTVSHGQICASCRKTLAENAKRMQAGEDAGTQETGHKIDTKARMKAERDKRQLATEVNENYHENRDINASDIKSSEQKQELKQQTEKKIRSSIFSKQSFLSEKKQTPPATNTPAQVQAETEIKVQTEQQNAKEERQKTQHDPAALQMDSQIAGQTRFQGVEFQKKRQEFLRRLGKDSPFMRHADQAQKTTEKNKGKETLEEHIEKTWGPGKKR